GGPRTHSAFRVFRVLQTLCAWFSSSGPPWTRYHTPLSPRSTRTAVMRRLALTSPWALCRRAQVDLATSSFFTEATCTRQPPTGPDMLSIRLAMLGPLSPAAGLVSVTAGAGVGAPGVTAAGVAACRGVGVLLATSPSG